MTPRFEVELIEGQSIEDRVKQKTTREYDSDNCEITGSSFWALTYLKVDTLSSKYRILRDQLPVMFRLNSLPQFLADELDAEEDRIAGRTRRFENVTQARAWLENDDLMHE